MKKMLFAAIFAASASVASAQINQGQYLVGGGLEFSSSKEGDYKTTEFSFSPNIGYFIINNLAAGLRVDLATSKSTFKFMNEEFVKKTNATSIAPFVRYYFLPSTQKINILADVSYGFGSVKYTESEGGESDSETGKFGQFSVAAGPAFFLTPNVSLEALVGYQNFKYKDAEDGTGTIGFKVGFQIHLGGGK